LVGMQNSHSFLGIRIARYYWKFGMQEAPMK
jgi:hypothetical protein